MVSKTNEQALEALIEQASPGESKIPRLVNAAPLPG